MPETSSPLASDEARILPSHYEDRVGLALDIRKIEADIADALLDGRKFDTIEDNMTMFDRALVAKVRSEVFTQIEENKQAPQDSLPSHLHLVE